MDGMTPPDNDLKWARRAKDRMMVALYEGRTPSYVDMIDLAECFEAIDDKATKAKVLPSEWMVE